MTCRPARAVLIVTTVAALHGCAAYGDWVGRMEGEIARQDPQAALQVLDNHSGIRGKDAALYQLNRAMLLRMKGEFTESNAAFEAAKTVIDQLLAVSITEQTGALAINDAQRSYTGEPFERAFIHVYEALNYLDIGKPDQARVEILQLDVLLTELERDRRFYGNALPRYLSGMIFEALGEWSDAMIAYRKAYEAYRHYPDRFAVPAPRYLGRDLVRAAERLGLTGEADLYRKEFNISDDELAPTPGQGEIIFLLHSGLAPVKQEAGIVAPTFSGRLVSVSMPYYYSRRPAVTGAALTADGATARTAVVEDIDAVATETLEQHRPAILARTVARAAVKYEASRRVSKENELLGFVVNVAGVVSERADTRSWSTLPNRVYLARLPLDAGTHFVRVDLSNRWGRAESVREYTVELAPGEKRFISLHRVTAQDLPTLAANGRSIQ